MLSTLLGASALFVGEFVSFLAPSKFPATFVIVFPALFNPSFVNFTGFAGSFLEVIVIPFPSTLVVFPSLSVTVVPPAFITVVISFVGSVASFAVIVVPVGVVTTEFPAASLTSTLLMLVNSGFN